MRLRRSGLAAVLLGCTLAVAALAAQGETVTPLFSGSLDGWIVENTDAGNFTVRDGLLRVEGPTGWLRSRDEYADFHLSIEFRFLTDDADSGVFFRTSGAEQFMRGWPNGSYQVQIRNPATQSRLPPVGGVFRHGMPQGTTTFDAAMVEKVARRTGEWQTLEIRVDGPILVVRVNGTEVTRASDLVERRGYIGIQGETGAVEFRAIRLVQGRE